MIMINCVSVKDVVVGSCIGIPFVVLIYIDLDGNPNGSLKDTFNKHNYYSIHNLILFLYFINMLTIQQQPY